MRADAGILTSPRVQVVLWIVAVVFMLSSAAFQRLTGPTRPVRGSLSISGESIPFRLVRSDWSSLTNEAARVSLPDPFHGTGRADLTGQIHYRRFRTSDPFVTQPMRREVQDGEKRLVGLLPAQPSAGKLEYYLTIGHENEVRRLPEAEGDNVVIRFKDHVPIGILLPHVVLMFLAVLFGIRAGLGALFGPAGMRTQAWAALAGMTIGGMILGPIVQKHAFGAYWTGFPVGGDWTDNKMLVMWLVWIVAAAVLALGRLSERKLGRVVVLLAALVMTTVYLIPHSTRGSELDYSKVDQGVDPAEAVRTGR